MPFPETTLKIRKAILPAGGLGTRLAPLTHLMPKEMLPLGDRVVLQHVIAECDAAGLDSLLVVLNRRKTALFPVGEETPCACDPQTGIPRRQVYFANQVEQGGLAHALLHALPFVGEEHFVVALGDSVVHRAAEAPQEDLLTRMIRLHAEHGAVATIAAQWVPEDQVSRYGIFEPAEAVTPGRPVRVRRVVEKPSPAEAPSRLAITARYVLSPRVLQVCRELPRGATGEMELTEAFSRLAAAGETVLAVPLAPGETRLDIGNPASYAAAFRLVSEGRAGE